MAALKAAPEPAPKPKPLPGGGPGPRASTAASPLRSRPSAGAVRYGAQVGVVLPSNTGLRVTAGTPSISVGGNATWVLRGGLQLRPRLDWTGFAGATQTNPGLLLSQVMDTRVSSLALGVDVMVPLYQHWSLGLAVSEVRWSVASTNTVSPATGGAMSTSGRSHWTRMGYGPVLSLQASKHLEVEFRALSSHFGYQNQPARTVSTGLLWRF